MLKHLGASLRTVHDGVAAVKGEGVLEFSQTLLGELVAGVDHPSVRLRDGEDSGFFSYLKIQFDLKFISYLNNW